MHLGVTGQVSDHRRGFANGGGAGRKAAALTCNIDSRVVGSSKSSLGRGLTGLLGLYSKWQPKERVARLPSRNLSSLNQNFLASF